MAVKVPCATAFVNVQGYNLNVTLRDYPGSELLLAKGDDIPEPMEIVETISQIVESTIAAWLRIAEYLGGVMESYQLYKSPEEYICKITPENEDPLVTVWGKYHGVTMTIISTEAPIYAYRAMKAWSAGIKAAGCTLQNSKPKSKQLSP